MAASPDAEAPQSRVRLVRLDGALAARFGDMTLAPDLARMLPRISGNKAHRELLVKAAKVRTPGRAPRAVDATAGLGEDALLLAAAGFEVLLFEHDRTMFRLLEDELARAAQDDRLSPAAGRMTLVQADSLLALPSLTPRPDVVYLDPMFPKREKSAAVEKKAQVLQALERPCEDEAALLAAAQEACPRKIVVKRPIKGRPLAGERPSYSLRGTSVRYDVYVAAPE